MIRAEFSVCLLTLVVLGPSSLAQDPLVLGPDCTVNVGNQTVAVRPDGTFLVPSISIFFTRDTGIAPQLYRARATCVRDGKMVTGQSDFFLLLSGGTVFSGPIFPMAFSPIPVSIAVTSLQAVLEPQGKTQLKVTALYANGSSADVTPRSAGTTYLSMNSALLTVAQDGLVTANNRTGFRQQALVAVLNEGNLATISLTVEASNDLDQDGMPNSFEDLHRLNRNLRDGHLDLDQDGLTNLREFQLGTLPRDPDTDEDGYLDGEDGDPLHPEEIPPSVAITSPADGTTLIEGTTVHFSVQASDEGRLVSVELSTSTGFRQGYTGPPFEVDLLVPNGIQEMSFNATAVDAVPNVAMVTRTLPVVPDPLTTVAGRVVRRGEPVAGAAVRVFDVFTGSTGADGGFSIPGVPTIRGPVSAVVEAVVNGKQLSATSSPMPPVASGVTDVGTLILLRPGTLSVTSTEGTAGAQATVKVVMDTDANLKGWAFGLCHDGAELAVQKLMAGPDTLIANDGGPPELLIMKKAIPPEEGVVMVVLLSFATTAVLPLDTGYEILNVTYNLLAQGGQAPVASQLCFCNTLIPEGGTQLVKAELVRDGGLEPIRPVLECGTVTIHPSQ